MAYILRIAKRIAPGILAFAILITGLMATTQTAYANSEHTLTYTKGKLVWTDATVDQNGVAVFDLFSDTYTNVHSHNTDQVIAPGTNGEVTVHLHNGVEGKVSYTAVLYYKTVNENLPVETRLNVGDKAEDTGSFDLPEAVSVDQIIRAVTGTVKGKGTQDLIINWDWPIDKDSELDTDLGNEQVQNEYLVGLYIVVEDGNTYTTPGGSPQTGGGSTALITGMLSTICIVGALILLYKIRRDNQCEH